MRRGILLLTLVATVCFAGPLNDQAEGQKFFNTIQRSLPINKDPVANDYITHLGYRLVSYSNKPSKTFHFFIINQDQINAFAGPGGYIGIFGGLIIFTQTESELASVLAHEIAHVTQNHLYRGSDKMKQTILPSIAAVAAAIASGDSAVAIGGISAIGAGNAQYSINTTRTYEKEADAIGIEILEKAGFNPHDMADFFEKMDEQSRYDMNVPPLLLTHPVDSEREAAAANRAAKFPNKKYTSAPDYYLVKIRLKAQLSQDLKHFLETSKDAVDKKPNDPYLQYQYALALQNSNQAEHSDKILLNLQKQYPSQIIYPYTHAELLAGQKKYSQAISVLEKLYQYNENYYPIVFLLGHTYIQNQQADKAIKLLDQYQVELADNINYWAMFSSAEGKAGNLIYAYLYRAKAYLLYGNKTQAKIQLEIAKQQPNQTPYTTQLIDAELKKLSKIK